MVLRLRYPPPNGWKNAKCTDIELTSTYDPFFGVELDGEGIEVDEDESKIHAVDFCNGTYDGNICPLRKQCLVFALTNNCKEGVWGGTNETTRKAIRKTYPPNKSGKPREEWHYQPDPEVLKLMRKGMKSREEDAE